MLSRIPKLGKHFLHASIVSIAVHATCLAGDLEKETSLRLAPVDADIYSASLNMKAQWERFSQSKVAQKMMETSIAKEVLEILKEDWDADDGELSQVRQVIENPNVISLIEMAQEMASNEGFLIADKNFSEASLGVSKLQESMYEAMGSDPLAVVDWILDMPKSRIDSIPVPMVVAGFKVEDQDRVLMHLDQLEGILRFGLSSVPQLASVAAAIERVETDRGTRLVINLDTEMIPWDEIPQNDEDAEELVEKLQELLEDRTLAISIGQLDEYFVFAMSEDDENIEALGEGENLMSHPDMKPLKDLESKMITGIGYISDHFSQLNFESTLDNYFSKLGNQILPALETSFDGDLPDFLSHLDEDLKWLDSSIGAHVPEFKGQLAVSFMTEKGQEGFVYNRTKAVVFDGSKQLDVLNHLGGSPVLFLAFRNQYHPEYFATARSIVQKSRNYLDGIAASEFVDGDEKRNLEMFLEHGWPILKRLADTWDSKFLPAMKDGQHAFVLTQGNLTSKQWAKDMPESDEPLPLPELAGIHGVSDEGLMIGGFVELFETIDAFLAHVSEAGELPPNTTVPRPVEGSVSKGKKYMYAIPDDCPAPKEMAPQAVFVDGMMITSYSDKLTDALINSKSLAVGTDVILANKPMASAAYMNFGAITTMIRPWLRYGMLQANGDLESLVVPEQGKFPGLTGDDVLELWDCLQYAGSMASTTTASDDGSTVTHWTFVE